MTHQPKQQKNANTYLNASDKLKISAYLADIKNL